MEIGDSSNKKRVLIVNNAIYLPGEGGYKRSMYLFDMMTSKRYDVSLLTSDFNHYNKRKRDIKDFRKKYPNYRKIYFVSMPKYKKNVSLQRYYSEKVWSRKASNWLKSHVCEFDVVYANMPDIPTIPLLAKICDQHEIKLIIDIRDLRPESFRVVVKNEFLYKLIFNKMKKDANKAYSCADELVAVSEEYLARGLQVNKRSKNAIAVYIGAPLSKFYDGVRKYSDQIIKPENEVWLIYVGTLGSSYDIKTLIYASKRVHSINSKVKLKIIGQGPEEMELKKYSNKIKAENIEFLGFMDYGMMAAYLSKSDMTVNAIKKNGSQSIINKIADYFASGKPILNGCLSREMVSLVENYQVGINYSPENPKSLIDSILFLINHPKLCELFGANALNLSKLKFDRENSYLRILTLIDNI